MTGSGFASVSKSDNENKEAADALENVGDVTSLIETDDGVYVAKLTSKLDREATDQKKKEIVEERKQKQYEDQGVNVKQTTTDSEK